MFPRCKSSAHERLDPNRLERSHRKNTASNSAVQCRHTASCLRHRADSNRSRQSSRCRRPPSTEGCRFRLSHPDRLIGSRCLCVDIDDPKIAQASPPWNAWPNSIANCAPRHVEFVVSAPNVARGLVSFFLGIASGAPPRAWLGEAAVTAAVGAGWDCRARVSSASAAVSHANAWASHASPTASLAAVPAPLTIAAASLAGALVRLAIAAASLAGALVCRAIAAASLARALVCLAIAIASLARALVRVVIPVASLARALVRVAIPVETALWLSHASLPCHSLRAS